MENPEILEKIEPANGNLLEANSTVMRSEGDHHPNNITLVIRSLPVGDSLSGATGDRPQVRIDKPLAVLARRDLELDAGDTGLTTSPGVDEFHNEVDQISDLSPEMSVKLRVLEGYDWVIQQAEEAVAETPIGHPNRLWKLAILSSHLHDRYNRSGALNDLHNSISRLEEAVAITSDDHHNRPQLLSGLAAYLGDRYKRLRGVKDLERAINLVQEALAVVPIYHPDRPSMLSSMGVHLGHRYQRFGELEDLERAINRIQEALETIPANHPERARILHNMGTQLGQKYRRSRELEYLRQAIAYLEESVAATPINDRERAGRLNTLGSFLRDRHGHLGASEDLERAIDLTQKALEITAPSHPSRIKWLDNLGCTYGHKYRRSGVLEYLESAISTLHEALAGFSIDHPDRPRTLHNLGIYLNLRYERTGALTDLDGAIDRLKESLEAIPTNHPERPLIFDSLGACLGDRYNRLGTLEDLSTAIDLLQGSLRTLPTEDPLQSTISNTLSCLLGYRYYRLGTLEDLGTAIDLLQGSLRTLPAEDPLQATTPNTLGYLLSYRYHRLGALKDLETAIKNFEQALAGTSHDYQDRAVILANLGTNYSYKYDRLQRLEDLKIAIDRQQESLEATPTGDPSRAARLNNLGSSFSGLYTQFRKLEDLEKAIDLFQEAVEATPDDHPNRALWLGNVAHHIGKRYKRSGTAGDLQKCLEVYNEVLQLLPSDHPVYGMNVFKLGGFLYHILWESSDDLYVFTLSVNQEAWGCKIIPPVLRILAASNAIHILYDLGKWDQACSLLEDAIELLPEVTLRHQQRRDHQNALSMVTSLASIAVAAFLQAGRAASECLGALELSRGIIMGLSIDCRSTDSLSELQKDHSELYERFNNLRTLVDSDMQYDVVGITYEGARQQRLETIRELEESLAAIRALPGFEEFQLPPSKAKLKAIAGEGPIIIINCTKWRSDAILITGSAIKALPLPGLVYSDVKERMKQLNQKIIRGGPRTYPSRNAKMEEFLLWLWEMVVEPVFKELELHPIVDPNSSLPRVWWIGVGAICRAPFHAAGNHSPGSAQNTLSRAISSYIPTIKALSYSREKQVGLLRGNSSLLLVAMPKTPNHKPLSSANSEVETIHSEVPKGSTADRLHYPSAADVLEKFPFYDAVHFTCHGVSDSLNPSDSRLLLCKGPEKIDYLTAEAISKINMQRAQLAYLSACSTADSAADDLAEESIHIASAFQLAGFSHVLASMWESNDQACKSVASGFYRLLFDDTFEPAGSDGGHRKVSTAFHQAVKSVRDKNWREPLFWVPFIHTGA